MKVLLLCVWLLRRSMVVLGVEVGWFEGFELVELELLCVFHRYSRGYMIGFAG